MRLAISALVMGEISPILLLPSVSKITTLLFPFTSFNRLTALANPIPIAVPSAISPLEAISVRTLCNILMSDVWSVVMGHCVKASPAKIVNPMLSLGRSAINSAATFFAASNRLGFKSSASMEVETSIASIMLIPSTCFSPHELCV